MDLFEREAPKLPDYGITRGADTKKKREGGWGEGETDDGGEAKKES